MRLMLMLMLLLAIFAGAGFAAEEVRQFDSEQERQLFKELTDELRCPKCQNQNIADSNANIAKDLRNKVFKLIKEGNDKDQVVDYMVDRYGYFVYYKPPLTPGTVILWLFPVLFVLFTMLLIWLKSKKSRQANNKLEWTETQEQELAALIAQIEQGQTTQKGAR